MAMSNSPTKLDGTLLLAGPSLRDGFFDHSVILLADHSEEDGALGLILNQPTGHTIDHYLKGDKFAPLKRIPVHVGGPVERQQLTFSAFWWDSEDGLHWQLRIPTKDAIKRARQPGTIVRAFLGYSGWTSGQLENELRHNSWITAMPEASLFGKEHDRELWTDILQSLSPYHRILSIAPTDPSAN